MIKHLQNYNKQILAVVSMLLLVVFLAPSAVTQCSRLGAGRSSTWATTADGTKMTIGDLEDSRAQLAVLELVGAPMMRQLGLDKNPDHWWLLVKEARDGGMVGGQADGRAMLEAMAAQGSMPADELLGRVCASSRQQPQMVLQALANLRGVERMVVAIAGSGRMSEARSRLAARELLTDVSCDVVPIDASAVGDAVPVPPPTADQLLATFEKGKSSAAGTGPGGIGYRFPDRVRIEWMMVPAGEVIRSLAADPALGPVELRKEFRKDPGRFGVPAVELEPGKPAPAFDAYAPKVREAVERRLLKERMERIAAAVREWNRAAMKDIPVEGGIAKLPAGWKERMPALGTLAADLAQRFSIPAPTVGSSGDAWLTTSEVNANAILSRGTTQEFGQPMRIGDLVAQLHEFKADSRLPVQVGVAGPLASTPNDDLIVWRVTEAQPAHDPASIDEVRDAVVKDALSQARYDVLASRSAEIEAKARKDGIDAVARDYGLAVQKAPGVHLADPAVLRQYGMRFAGSMPTAGQDIDALRAVVAKAVSLPGANPVSTLPDSDRIIAVPVPGKLALLVVRITDVRPLTVEDFRSLESSGALRSAIAKDEPNLDWKAAFGKDALVKRTGFALKNPQGPDRVTAPDAPMF